VGANIFNMAIIALLISITVLLPFASTNPDGLKRVAESLDIEESEPIWHGLMPDYSFTMAENPYISTLFSGAVGIFLVLILTWILAWRISKEETHP
jgi:hypothetical protein